MYEFKHESQKKERKFKLYFFLFIISVLVNVYLDFFDFGIRKTSGFNIVANLLISATILYFGLRRKLWAEWFIKFLVWINVIFLIIVILVKIFE